MHTNMDGEQNKSEEINVAGVTCLLAAQMEALIERKGIFSFPNQEPPLTTLTTGKSSWGEGWSR